MIKGDFKMMKNVYMVTVFDGKEPANHLIVNSIEEGEYRAANWIGAYDKDFEDDYCVTKNDKYAEYFVLGEDVESMDNYTIVIERVEVNGMWF